MDYAGDKECKETFETLLQLSNSALVDVRTTREWETIGIPTIPGSERQPLFVEWQMFPSMAVNPDFAETVHNKLVEQGLSNDAPVFFLCRSGARSQGAAAAMTAMGYSRAYNVKSGFEGVPDSNGERTRVNGWVHDGLPAKLPKKSNE